MTVFDCPGINSYLNLIQNPWIIPNYLGPIGNVYYLYDGDIDEDFVETIRRMKKNIFFVRTKCDPDEENRHEND